ncbi:hypothetical protein E2562_038539 [Oryza meyeriana var. granulata]|uniref:Uncharacterized protein n=1 Tax=Oryza meyeriana var. granulata TaxID=110450 RepID=A0A6G1BP93_9ORYZ|nr:hypothetical protein E2562_038539 [Oryza meyeriana var. granulata]
MSPLSLTHRPLLLCLAVEHGTDKSMCTADNNQKKHVTTATALAFSELLNNSCLLIRKAASIA